MEKKKEVLVADAKKRLADILVSVSWRDIANNYFNRSSSWFYHKFDGIDGNGGTGGFTPEEAEQLYGALNDLADRIRRSAESLRPVEELRKTA